MLAQDAADLAHPLPALGRELQRVHAAIEVAWPPLDQLLFFDWYGSHDLQLGARLLKLASAQLDGIDFRPAAIRANRRGAGESLMQIAWTLQLASQLKAAFAASTTDSDRLWTTYLDVLDRPPRRASGLP